MSDETLKRTNLYEWHVAHGGRMVPFAGWEMPVQYPTGPTEEHHATRNAAGLFDIDHMAQFSVNGADAEAYLNHMTSWDTTLMQVNDAHYALLCYDDGTIVDDIYLYRLPNRWFVALNASNREKDLKWMQSHTDGFDVTVTDVSDETYMMALQGPKAIEILQKVTEVSMASVPRFTVAEGNVAGIPTLISRTGYTGEDGVELFFDASRAVEMWETLLKVGEPLGLKPVGLAARDSLRFEPSFPLYGHEISADVTPIEARLGWALKLNKPFIGRDAILKVKLEGPQKLLVGFEMVDKGVPREHYRVAVNGEFVGEVVTGIFAPTVGKFAGHAYVPAKFAKVGTKIQIEIRGKLKEAVIIRRPFYRPAYK